MWKCRPPHQNSPQSFAFWETTTFLLGPQRPILRLLAGKVSGRWVHKKTISFPKNPDHSKSGYFEDLKTPNCEIQVRFNRPFWWWLKSCSWSGRKFPHEKTGFGIHARWVFSPDFLTINSWRGPNWFSKCSQLPSSNLHITPCLERSLLACVVLFQQRCRGRG